MKYSKKNVKMSPVYCSGYLMDILINFLPVSLLITIENSLDPDQARQNVGPDKDLNCCHSL